MREYEFTFVVQPEITDEGIEAIQQRFEGILDQSGSEKLFYEDWGRRRLAYEIRKFQKGHYQVLHFLSDGAVVPELERSARLDDSILRFLTVLANEEVRDLDGRRSEAVGLEEERVKRAAERAAREAEEAAEAERAAREAAARDEAAAQAADADAGQASDASPAQDAGETAESEGSGGEGGDPSTPESAASPDSEAEKE